MTVATAEETGETVTNAAVSLEQMAQSVLSELQRHGTELVNLNERLRSLTNVQTELQAQIKDYETQNTVHGQLLLMDRVQTGDLENAIRDNRLASRALSETVEKFQRNRKSQLIDFEKNQGRIEFARQQILDIEQSDLPISRKQQLVESIQQLLQTLEDKKRVEGRILGTYDDMLRQATSALEAKKSVGDRLTTTFEKLRISSITERMEPYRGLGSGELLKDMRSLRDSLLAALQFNTWKKFWRQIQMGGLVPWMIFMALLVAMVVFQGRFRRFFKHIEDRYEETNSHYRRLSLLLLRRSLPYLVLTLLFWGYSSIQISLFNIALARFLFYLFFVLLVARWGLDFIEYGFEGPQTALRIFVSLQLKRFILFFGIALITVMVLSLMMGMDSLLAWLVKNIVIVVLMSLDVIFWRRMKTVLAGQAREGLPAPSKHMMTLIRGMTYLVLGGSLVLNLAGYSTLTAQWFRAWAESAVLLLWGWMGYKVLQEWHRSFLARLATANQQKPMTSGSYCRLSLIQLAWVVWLFTLTTALVRCWDPSGVIWSGLTRSFDLTFSVGSLNFSIKGIVLAVLIIFVTHLLLRVGRALLKEKVLDKRSIERGLRDSVLTIVSYLGWALGLVLALGLLGVNTTSLAVIFGALSIGIGFGLQNIFNNFISGLILLFERPIQVGDYVEIGGLWAEVKKINVRSTVVQTFDNASVIIPNSEFISQQVTNWSFKDKRMRRNLEVGVAYGSDVALVEKTLMEIALETRGVLKYPQPDVIFVDHADSALIFRLRIWVDVDDYWKVASQIRFDIDRRFQKLEIEIAFPQRDLHIRTLPSKMETAICQDNSRDTSTDSQEES
jgi:small-conductance mechanosensitive channel